MKNQYIVKNTYFGTRPLAFHHHGRPTLGNKMQSCKPASFNKYGFKRQVMESCCNSNQIFKARKETKCLLKEDGYPQDKCYKAPTPAHIYNHALSKSELQAFTISNINEPGSAVRQLRHFGIEVPILGRNIVSYDHDVKIPLLIKFIPTIEKKYTMFFDSDDIWFSEDPTRLLKNFEKALDCKMLCNGDAWFFPKGGPIDMMRWMENTADSLCKKNKSPYKYLNSGLWIAETKFLQEEFLPRLKVLRAAQDLNMSIQTHSNVDQSLFHYLYRDLYPAIKVDHSCMFFQSWSWSPWCERNYKGANSLEIIKS